MYRKILAAVNEHINSEIAARYAIHFALAEKSSLYICYVAEKGVSENTFRNVEHSVKKLFQKAIEQGLKAETIFDSGDPAERIRTFAKSEKVDLVFAATRREDIEKRFYAKTTARRLLLTLPCSVALVRVVHMGRIHPKHILIPLKAKIDHIEERSYFTAKMAQGFKSKVFLFHTTRPITRFFHGEVHLTPVEWEKRLPEDIAIFMEHLKRLEIEHEGRLLPGTVAKSITIEAASKRHDLIIMGASERSLLKSIIKGNPVEDVLKETPCDLIIFKPRHENL